MAKWEYKIINDDQAPIYGNVMCELGEHGWELVSVCVTMLKTEASRSRTTMYFKRVING